MKKNIFAIALISLLNIAVSYAQVGMTGNNPDRSAALDINAPNKGLLITKISLPATNNVSVVSNPVKGLLIYNTNSGITGTGAQGTGFYYYDGSIWKKLQTTTDVVQDNLGNHTATQDLNMQSNQIFFKRADGNKLNLLNSIDGPGIKHASGWNAQMQAGFKNTGAGQFTWANYSGANNDVMKERMRLTETGNLGIGTATPAAKLEVAGDAILESELYAKNLPTDANDPVLTINSSGTLTRGKYRLSDLATMTTYQTGNIANGASGSAVINNPPVYMLTIATYNGCARTGISVFMVNGSTISYMGGQARVGIYAATQIDASTISLSANIGAPCQDKGGINQFDYKININGNTITVTNMNGTIPQNYNLQVIKF